MPTDPASTPPQNGDLSAEAAAPETTDAPSPLETRAKEAEQKYVYLYAEFENYKKRMQKERSDLVKFGWEGVARELLSVLDNLERALAFMPENADKNMVEGIRMVSNQFGGALQKGGVERVKAKDAAFDPAVHEAVGSEPSDKPQGTILQEHQGGYTLHGRLLRPARVVLSAGQATP
jgi:molecular chaperone GrpE